MSQSKLVNVTILTNHIGYPDGKHGRGGAKIDKIFVHHMAGILTAKQCGNVFKSRPASAHYGIGSDGKIGQYVKEEDTAWHCASKAYNQRSIGIELSNDTGAKGNWHVADKTIAKCIDLIVDICKRNGIKKINYTGDLKGNLCMHRWTASTSCPGPYLKTKFKYIATQVNKKLTASADKKGYTGTFPTYHLTKSNAKVKSDACTWAKKITKNNDFHYGSNSHAYHNGCYYCDTNKRMKKGHGMKMWNTTYCCNPFVGAAWAHGGCVPEALKMCKNCDSWGFSKSEGYEKSKLFDKLGHPAKSKLKAGDVLCGSSHVVLYIGDGKIAEAAHRDNNKVGSDSWNDSIRVATLTDERYKDLPRAYRFNSKVDVDLTMYHGEYSDRIKDLQNFLNWYYGAGLKVSGFYNDKTLKYVKKFQKEVGLDPTGKVGKKTIAAMKKAKK